MTSPASLLRDDGYLQTDPEDLVLPLPAVGGLRESVHVFEPQQLLAVNAALATRRPLLVRGEPGTGKSQLARAAAEALDRAFLHHAVDQRTETRDLQWRLDAVARLARAQIAGTLPPGERDLDALLDLTKFIVPGPLWWAFEPHGATKQARCAGAPAPWMARPGGDAELESRIDRGVVLLIDEIDKADPSVPNGLLDALGHGSFHVVDGAVRVSLNERGPPEAPLVVITTNRERVLPDAFVRRCVVLPLALPDEGLEDFLVERGVAHFEEWRVDDAVPREAARQLVGDRERAVRRHVRPPGLAEYIDLLEAVRQQAKTVEAQLSLLTLLQSFFYDKHPDEYGS